MDEVHGPDQAQAEFCLRHNRSPHQSFRNKGQGIQGIQGSGIMEKGRLAVVRVKGDFGNSADIKMTLKLLRLYKKNYCVVLPTNPQIIGMVQKIKDLVTFGEVSKEMMMKLLKARGRVAGNKPLTEDYLKSKTNATFENFADELLAYKKELRDVPGLKQFFR